MNSAPRHEPPARPFTGAVPGKCFVCGDPVGERSFCQIPRPGAGPIVLCCPDCLMQYLDSGCVPDTREEELRSYEKSLHFFIGENKPWL